MIIYTYDKGHYITVAEHIENTRKGRGACISTLRTDVLVPARSACAT